MRSILLALAIVVLPACTDDTSTHDAGILASDVVDVDSAVIPDVADADSAVVPDAADMDSAVVPDVADMDSAVVPDAADVDSAVVPDAADVDSAVIPDASGAVDTTVVVDASGAADTTVVVDASGAADTTVVVDASVVVDLAVVVDAPPDTQSTVTGGACVNPVTPPIEPCVGWSTVRQSYCNTADPSQVIMVTCSGSDTQCMAHTVCAPGWHLCSGTEYLARGGKTVPQDPSIIRAWIGACGRDYTGADLVDGVCSSCAENEINVPWAMLWDCQGAQVGPGMADGTIGVVTDDQCLRLGKNTPLNGGYWSYYWASGVAGGSLCCLDSP